MELYHYREPLGPTGGIYASAIGNLMGRPELDRLEIAAREAAQNAWDARLPDQIPHFSISHVKLHGASLTSWRQAFGVKSAKGKPPLLVGGLQAADLDLLFFQDLHTLGLNGDMNDRARSSRFFSFVFNTGKGEVARDGGAGTYGYGKSSLLNASRVGTMLVYSRALTEGKIESRLIGVSLCNDEDDARFTGRHFWGEKAGRVLRGVTGRRADAMAAGLGFPAFAVGGTGTVICILNPEWGEAEEGEERTSAAALHHLRRVLVEQSWPHIVDASMRLFVQHPATSVASEVTQADFSPLEAAFAEAYEARPNRCSNHDGRESCASPRCYIREDAASLVRTRCIFSERPRRRLGKLLIKRMPLLGQMHVVGIRGPQFVIPIKSALVEDGLGLVATFVVAPDAEIQQAFADSEPPAHNLWDPSTLASAKRSIVKVALRKIAGELDALRGEILGFRPGGDTVNALTAGIIAALGETFGVTRGPVEDSDRGRDVGADRDGDGGGVRDGDGGGVRDGDGGGVRDGDGGARKLPVRFEHMFAENGNWYARLSFVIAETLTGSLDVQLKRAFDDSFPRLKLGAMPTVWWEPPATRERIIAPRVEAKVIAAGAWSLVIQQHPDALLSVDVVFRGDT